MTTTGSAPCRVAIIDGASFVLPYAHALAGALTRTGAAVSVFASSTRYNASFLQHLRQSSDLHGAPAERGVEQGRASSQPHDVQVIERAVSGSVVPRWRGLLGYIRLLAAVWRGRAQWSVVNLQFSVLWPLEWPLLWWLRRRFVFTVHNAVPHGHSGRQHAPTRRLAALARALVFASTATRDDFLQRYGERFAAKAHVLPHGLLPVLPGEAPHPVRPCVQPQALVFWGTVKPYKGIELMADIARSPQWQAYAALEGITLEVHGRWDAALHGLRDELSALGVQIHDRYLDAAALHALFARHVLFLLPYREASQSGALYTLLHQGCTFVCADVGDLGDFLRRHGLQALLLADRSPGAVLQALQRLHGHAAAVASALQAAQDQCSWDAALARVAGVYGAPVCGAAAAAAERAPVAP